MTKMHKTIDAAIRYIEWMGANQTEKKEPHPQQQLLDELKELQRPMLFGDEKDRERERRISAFLNWDDEEEISTDLIKIARRLATDNPESCHNILTGLSSVASSAISTVKKEYHESWRAAERGIQLLDLPEPYTASQWVVAATPIVKVIFPEGHCNVTYASQLTRQFFEKFVDAYKKCQFEINDGTWVRNMGYAEYFKKVEKANNI